MRAALTFNYYCYWVKLQTDLYCLITKTISGLALNYRYLKVSSPDKHILFFGRKPGGKED